MRRATELGAMILALGACGDDGAGRPDAGPTDAATLDARSDEDAGPPVIVLPDEPPACAARNPERNAYFGDLHVHTRLSFDASIYDVRSGPREAYRFARGEEIGLPPYDAAGAPTRTIRLARPLDFAAVTDHSEFLAEIAICTDPSSPGFDSTTCRTWREASGEGGDYGEFTSSLIAGSRPQVCRADPALCASARTAAWGLVQDAAEEAYDRSSACSFTTFVAYEWTGTTGGSNNHRNVIFRTRSVPHTPTTFLDARTTAALWDALDSTCNDTGTPCAVLAIPHNGNLSAGGMFVAESRPGVPYTRDEAERRARHEPLVEIFQHKGASECLFTTLDPLGSEDELCGFELLSTAATPFCHDMPGIGFLGGCVEADDFARGGLRNGLLAVSTIGVNPFRFGFIGSTDTHNAIPGATDEASWQGHLGDTDDTVAERVAFDVTSIGGVRDNPGGLAVIWSDENSRPALYDAMRRRETYATSGTRIVARFFGGWAYAPDLCGAADMVARGYADGVPMGGDLPAPGPGETAPTFVATAMRDPSSAPLERLQIVKGWVQDGTTRERVYDVAGTPVVGPGVDLSTCEPTATGADTLCAVWTDPDFDPASGAFYYLRAVETPSCRWSRRLCNDAAVDCATLPATDPLHACCDPTVPSTIQERAATSPIVYAPEPD